MSDQPPTNAPSSYERLGKEHPGILAAYESFAGACLASGPLDARTAAIIKLAISLGAGLDGAAKSHARKALEAGWTADQLLHAAHLTGPTVGFPSMMRNRKLILEVTGRA